MVEILESEDDEDREYSDLLAWEAIIADIGLSH